LIETSFQATIIHCVFFMSQHIFSKISYFFFSTRRRNI